MYLIFFGKVNILNFVKNYSIIFCNKYVFLYLNRIGHLKIYWKMSCTFDKPQNDGINMYEQLLFYVYRQQRFTSIIQRLAHD